MHLTLDEHLKRLQADGCTKRDRERAVYAIHAELLELRRIASTVAETARRAHDAEVENAILRQRIDDAEKAVAGAAAALAQTKRDRAFLAGRAA